MIQATPSLLKLSGGAVMLNFWGCLSWRQAKHHGAFLILLFALVRASSIAFIKVLTRVAQITKVVHHGRAFFLKRLLILIKFI
jgi:hypothetical protein